MTKARRPCVAWAGVCTDCYCVLRLVTLCWAVAQVCHFLHVATAVPDTSCAMALLLCVCGRCHSSALVCLDRGTECSQTLYHFPLSHFLSQPLQNFKSCPRNKVHVWCEQSAHTPGLQAAVPRLGGSGAGRAKPDTAQWVCGTAPVLQCCLSKEQSKMDQKVNKLCGSPDEAVMKDTYCVLPGLHRTIMLDCHQCKDC